MLEASVIALQDFASTLPQAHRRQEDLIWAACGQRFPVPEQRLHATPLYFSLAGLRDLLATGVGVPPRQTRDRTT